MFYRIRSWQSSDGSGIPDWWEIEYFGTNGVDPYSDPTGDGWTVLQDFQNGWNPNVFNTPPTPEGVTTSLNQASNTATVSWLPNSGNVTSYTVEKTDTYAGTVQYSNVTATATSYLDTISSDTPDPWDGNNYDVSYRIKANYASGSSAWSASIPLQQPTVSASITSGANGASELAVSGLPANASTVRLVFIDENALENGDTSFDYAENISVSSITNGLVSLPTAWQPPATDAYGDSEYASYVESVDTSGKTSAANPIDYQAWSPPFYDGRVQLKQNLKFLLRAATVDNSFGYYTDIPIASAYPRTFPTNYAEASFYQNFTYYDENIYSSGSGSYYFADNPPFLNILQPFQDNYLYENCDFNASLLNGGFLATGILQPGFGTGNDFLVFSNTLAYTFTPPLTNGTPIAALGPDQAQWLATGQYIYRQSFLAEIGIVQSPYTYFSGGNYITGFTNTMLEQHKWNFRSRYNKRW